ncbi:MAG: 16S rRNA (cytidine(1402)-2'-O)-methyltransferase [Burkholderiales bacterium]|nr:16S rRNA (cytidine(1402)-2'-O)-methyltransferase [Burkholderiales bacterium]
MEQRSKNETHGGDTQGDETHGAQSERQDHEAQSSGGAGKLYVVATPIGNLGDISARALAVLAQADLVAAEDTRTTGHLLAHHGISTKLIALHEHNEMQRSVELVARIKSGKTIALVSDAGTPGISDPGALLVARAREAGVVVSPIPGANAAVAALSASGLTAPHFLFYGFLPVKSAARHAALEVLRELPYTLVFYEAPHRVTECVAALAAALGGEREIVIARELTKLFETIHRCRLDAAGAWLAEDANRQRGEFVLIVSGAQAVASEGLSAESERILRLLLAELPLKQAVALAAAISGARKNELYARALVLREDKSR